MKSFLFMINFIKSGENNYQLLLDPLPEIQRLNVLPKESIFDQLHIASAVFSCCNIIVSWNFRHIVNVKTIDGVRMVCFANNIGPIDIYSPDVLLERRDLNE